jgi:hypothetical protein
MRGVTLVRGCPRSLRSVATLAKESQGQNTKSGDRGGGCRMRRRVYIRSDYTRFSANANFLVSHNETVKRALFRNLEPYSGCRLLGTRPHRRHFRDIEVVAGS